MEFNTGDIVQLGEIEFESFELAVRFRKNSKKQFIKNLKFRVERWTNPTLCRGLGLLDNISGKLGSKKKSHLDLVGHHL